MKENNSFEESIKNISISEKDQLVQSVLEKGALDKPSLIQKTGLSPLVLDESIKNLMKIYPCHLEIDENQNLVYYFDFENPYEHLSTPLEKIKNIALKVFKVSMFLLPLYFLSPIIVLYSYIIQKQGIGGIVTGFIWGIVLFLAMSVAASILWYYLIAPIRAFFIFYYKPIHSLTPKYAFIEGQPVPDDVPDTTDMIQAIHDFVFGTKREKPYLEIEKRILNFLSHNNFKFNISELTRLTGWSIEQANKEACHFVANYDGTFEINEKGFIEFFFHELSSIQQENIEKPPFIWDKKVELFRWNDNPRSSNISIFVFHYFIFFSCFLLFLFGRVLPYWYPLPIFSLIYVITFLSIFIIGKQKMLNKNQHILFENDYYKFIERIFKHPEGVFLPKYGFTERAVRELEGETAIDANGELYYHFPRLCLELKN